MCSYFQCYEALLVHFNILLQAARSRLTVRTEPRRPSNSTLRERYTVNSSREWHLMGKESSGRGQERSEGRGEIRGSLRVEPVRSCRHLPCS